MNFAFLNNPVAVVYKFMSPIINTMTPAYSYRDSLDATTWTTRYTGTSISGLTSFANTTLCQSKTNPGTLIMFNKGASQGTFARSTDGGTTWSSASLPASYDIRDVAYGRGNFVAVGLDTVLYSTDEGATWTYVNPPGTDKLYTSVVYNSGTNRWAAVSGTFTSAAAVMYSTNGGASWTAGTIANRAWRQVVYFNNLFVAVCTDGTNRIATSTNAVNWTTRTTSSNTWYTLISNGTTLVALSNDTRPLTMYSTNATTWTSGSSDATGSNVAGVSRIVCNKTLFMFTYSILGGGTVQMRTSPDGITWSDGANFSGNIALSNPTSDFQGQGN